MKRRRTMNKIIRKIKKMFCKSGQVYKVNIKDIIISEEFRATHPRFKKMVQNVNFTVRIICMSRRLYSTEILC